MQQISDRKRALADWQARLESHDGDLADRRAGFEVGHAACFHKSLTYACNCGLTCTRCLTVGGSDCRTVAAPHADAILVQGVEPVSQTLFATKMTMLAIWPFAVRSALALSVWRPWSSGSTLQVWL